MSKDIKVTMKLDKKQLVDVIAYWLKAEHDYTLNDKERDLVIFNLKEAGMSHDPYKVFGDVTLSLDLGFNNFKR